MRILLVSDFLPPVRGGLENHVVALARGLTGLGHELAIATLTRDAEPIAKVSIYTLSAASRKLPHADADRPFHLPMDDPLARRSLNKVISDFKPEVIHAHSASASSVPDSGIPLVLTLHDYGLICVKRTLLRSDAKTCSGPTLSKCVPCAAESRGTAVSLGLTLATTVGRRALRPAAVLAVSTSVADSVQPFLNSSVEVVPNFVSDKPDSIEPFNGLPATPFVMYAGDPSEHKGVGDLIQIWAGSGRPPVPLVLATTRRYDGDLPEGVSNVTLSPGEVAYAWENAFVAVVPSRWAEPCPTVALEALRAGVPVVAYRIGGLPDLVRHGVDGFLVPPGEVAALRERITEIVTDSALHDRLSDAAREGAGKFSASRVVSVIEAVYERVVTSGTAGVEMSETGRDQRP